MNGWKEWYDLHGEHEELESWDDVWQMVGAQMNDDAEEEKVMRYRVELVGRQPGAIGKEHKINLEIEAVNPEEAREKVFAQYEVWAITKVEEVNNG